MASCVIGQSTTITLSATDPESDPLTYSADFLTGGMSFDPATQTLTYQVGQTCPSGTAYVRFRVTTPSGGTDALIAACNFGGGGSPRSSPSTSAEAVGGEKGPGPNPTNGRFVVVFALQLCTACGRGCWSSTCAGGRLPQSRDRRGQGSFGTEKTPRASPLALASISIDSRSARSANREQ